MMKTFEKFKNLPDEILANAYNILYANHLSVDERLIRPESIKVARIKEVLSGDVTPGCQSKEWFLFFEYLNKSIERIEYHEKVESCRDKDGYYIPRD